MDGFEKALLRYFTSEQLNKIQRVQVVLLGAGGLGSNCAACLVRSGFQKLRLVDFDVVEPSNLNRQFFFYDQIGRPKVEALAENLRRIRPGLVVETEQQCIAMERLERLTSGCDIVIEAVDGAQLKKQIAEFCIKRGRMLISASGMGGISGSDQIHTRKIGERFYIVGDFESDVESGSPPYAPKVTVVAAKQAALALEYCLTGTCKMEDAIAQEKS